MLYNLAKMSITSASEWPQLEQEVSSMVATTKLTEKPPQDRQPLRCPRCDSSNTKFCYFNNYSLTQPRHFCKACKRYWTRGGTLRNVPVGGGCRKNKSIKRPAAADGSNLPPNPSPPDVSRTGASIYGLASTPPNMASFAIPALRSGLPSMNLENYCASISSSGLDVPPQQSSPWLNFPSEKFASNSDDVEYQSGLNPNPNQFQESASLWPDNSTCSASYLLSPTFNEQKLLISLNEKGTPNDLMAFFPVGDHLSVGSTGGSSNILKGVKMEEENAFMSNRTDWQIPCNSSIDNIGSNLSSYWNSGMFGPWREATGSFTPWH